MERSGYNWLPLKTIEDHIRLSNNTYPIFEMAETIQRICNPPALKALQRAIQMPYASLATQTAAITAPLMQAQAITAAAFHPAIEAVAMCQQPYMSMAAAMTEYQRTLEHITRIPELMKILPALEYLHTEHPASYQEIDSILSVEMDKDTPIEQYIQKLLLKIKDTTTASISDLPQYLFGLAQSLDLISPFVDEPVRTGIDQLNSLIIVLAYIILQNIPKSK